MEHDLDKNIGDVDVYTQFEMLKVKVPIIFLGTVGFSLLREGRCLGVKLISTFTALRPLGERNYAHLP
jgi:hypothetical protein